MPAQTTAQIVIASAKRLIELRHCCLKRSRIAEISVPAWPMPIHQTKLMMANPQATGMVIAQMPVPTRNSQVTAVSSTVAPAPARLNNANQPIGVEGVSTMLAIFSVIDRKVCPGAITRYSPVAGSIVAPRLGSFGFRSVVAIVPLNPAPDVQPARFQVPDSNSPPRQQPLSADAYSDRPVRGSCARLSGAWQPGCPCR